MNTGLCKTEKQNSDMPLISIVIPAYNASLSIKKSVYSALNQTYKNIEVLVIDDASTDDTAFIIRKLAETDSRIHPIIKEKNGGVSAARNTGIKAAKGEWLITLDGDDYFEETMAERLLETVLKDGSDVCICGFRTVYEENCPKETAHGCNKKSNALGKYDCEKDSICIQDSKTQTTGENFDLFEDGLNQIAGKSSKAQKTGENFEIDSEISADSETFLSKMLTELYDKHLISTHSNKIYKMQIIKENGIFYNESLAVNEDIDFVLRYLSCCRKMSAVKGIYQNYVQHDTGKSLITTFRENGIEGALLVLRDFNELIAKNFPYLETSGGDVSGKKTADTEKTQHMVKEMKERMFIHICSFTGIMYKQSGYHSEKKKAVLKKLFENEDFRQLARKTKPKDLKDAVALMLIRSKAVMLYHILCSLIY